MSRTIADRIASAQGALADGFTSKAGQKAALDTLSRGYDTLREVVGDRHRAAARAQWPVDTRGYPTYNWAQAVEYMAERDLPFQLNYVRDKHFAYLLTAAEVPQLRQLLALREKIKAAPITAKTSKPKREIEREGKAMTCQICGRGVLAQTGVIAHHGYQRPIYQSGWQTASCAGARALPFEADRDELGHEISNAEARLAHEELWRADVAAETKAATWVFTDRRERGRLNRTAYRPVARETFADIAAAAVAEGSFRLSTGKVPVFDDILAADIARRDQTIASLRAYIDRQQARYDAWPGVTHRYFDGEWRTA